MSRSEKIVIHMDKTDIFSKKQQKNVLRFRVTYDPCTDMAVNRIDMACTLAAQAVSPFLPTAIMTFQYFPIPRKMTLQND